MLLGHSSETPLEPLLMIIQLDREANSITIVGDADEMRWCQVIGGEETIAMCINWAMHFDIKPPLRYIIETNLPDGRKVQEVADIYLDNRGVEQISLRTSEPIQPEIDRE